MYSWPSVVKIKLNNHLFYIKLNNFDEYFWNDLPKFVHITVGEHVFIDVILGDSQIGFIW